VLPESRDEFGNKLDEINDSVGIDLKKVAEMTGDLAMTASTSLAASAEAATEVGPGKQQYNTHSCLVPRRVVSDPRLLRILSLKPRTTHPTQNVLQVAVGGLPFL
jgi:hypothetical protein